MPEAAPRWRCEDEAREALLAAAGRLVAAGAPGSASLSLRWPRSAAAGMLAISAPLAPTATVDAVAWVPLDSRHDRPGTTGAALPPDWRLHRELLGRRPGVQAVTRCRPVFCMTLACSPRRRQAGIPSLHPDGGVPSDGIRCAQPAGVGAAAFADRVDEALGDRGACLLPNEGLLTVGSTLEAAVGMVATVETFAQVWWQLSQAEHRETDGVAA